MPIAHVARPAAVAAEDDKIREVNRMKKNCVYIKTALTGILFLFILTGVFSPVFAAGQQKVFATPGQAVSMLLEAFRTNNTQTLLELLGAENKDIIVSSDRAQDAYGRKKFYQLASERLFREKEGKDKIILLVGKQEWPFPFPLVKKGAGWSFDGVAGREEVINRRVGRNELNAIATCRLYAKAQREYYSRDRNGDDVMEYAQKFGSSPGKKDGLFWPRDPSQKEEASPFEPLLDKSRQYAMDRKQGEPFYGYYYRILTRQGEQAPGGAYDYMVNGHLVAGYALIAYPADYGTSGVMTFIVNQRGKVYQKDLGPETKKLVEEITRYNPDKTWRLVQDNGMLATD
jgi:hypothetical protein